MSYWQNKVVIVTGGSRGLGQSIARAMGDAGAKVVLAARDADVLARCATDMRASGADVLAVPTDITSPDQVDRLVRQAIERYGRLDALVNNAGKSARGRIADTTAEDFRQLLELNFLAMVRCTRAALPHLLASGGHVINIASLAAKVGSPLMGAYPGSKFPVVAYTQQLRLELEPEGLHTLVVCTGPVDRHDAGTRYAEQTTHLPDSAILPGGGARLARIDPDRLAQKILTAAEKNKAELIVPGRARCLFAIGQVSPRIGDWLVRKFTRG